ncbi:MAG: hypothetical protein NW205_06105 [Hyphomicrobiaceae bacterium]|nr:hypothetical protein [Hyphomicrobiaceae bacterium]
MSITERIALACIAFGAVGLAIASWHDGHAVAHVADRPAYFLAISAGPGLRLGETDLARAEPGQLACEQVFKIAGIDIGTSCMSHGWRVSIEP